MEPIAYDSHAWRDMLWHWMLTFEPAEVPLSMLNTIVVVSQRLQNDFAAELIRDYRRRS